MGRAGIPQGEALASLQRLLNGIDAEGMGHKPIDETQRQDTQGSAQADAILTAARDQVREWQVAIRTDQMNPNDLPGRYQHEASQATSYPRLAKLFLAEYRVLDAMRYGSDRWYDGR